MKKKTSDTMLSTKTLFSLAILLTACTFAVVESKLEGKKYRRNEHDFEKSQNFPDSQDFAEPQDENEAEVIEEEVIPEINNDNEHRLKKDLLALVKKHKKLCKDAIMMRVLYWLEHKSEYGEHYNFFGKCVLFLF